MHKARVYFYLDPPGAVPKETGPGPGRPTTPVESTIGLSESEIMSFIHDTNHRCEVILALEKTEESARTALEAKHPRHTVRLKSVTWLC